jgi:hypothetical protein
MGQGQLRSKRQDIIAENFTIDSNQSTRFVDIGSTEDVIGIQAIWVNGSSVNMQISLEVSNDKSNWVEIPTTIDTITSNADSYFWDIRTGAEFIRVKFVVISGQADFTINLNAKSR